MCNCHSYNWHSPEEGGTPNALLSPPKELGFTKDVICVDACIAHVVDHLWKSGVVTLGSCCGHNRMNPSIGINDSATKEDADHVRSLISKVDNREFTIYSWKLTEV